MILPHEQKKSFHNHGRNGDFIVISYEKLDKKIDSTRTQDLKANYFGRLIQHMLQKKWVLLNDKNLRS